MNDMRKWRKFQSAMNGHKNQRLLLAWSLIVFGLVLAVVIGVGL